MFLNLFENLAIAGFDRGGRTAIAEVIDADEEKGRAGRTVEERFIEAFEYAAIVAGREGIADHIGTDAAIEHGSAGEEFGDVEAFGDAIADEDDVLDLVVI